jgi:hypothetical protein
MKNQRIHTVINMNASQVKLTGSVCASTRRLNSAIIKSGKNK